jgi:hypothetical protein
MGAFFLGIARVFDRKGKQAIQFLCGCIVGRGMDFRCPGHRGVRGLDFLCR